MSETVTLYHNPMSRGRIAQFMLEEAGAPYEVKLLAFDKGEQKKPEFLRLNPMGKLPTIVHRGVVVTEAPAICAYVADAFPAAGLAPAVNDPARGTYLRWLFFGASALEYALMDKAFPRVEPARAGQIGYGTFDDTMNALEKAIAPGPWILGDRFSAADVYLGSQMGWALMMKSLDPRPAFLEYVGRINERPAMKRTAELNNKYVEQMKAG